MDYKIFITKDAEEDLDRYVRYLLFEKKNEQAAGNLLDDFEATKNSLSRVAGSLKVYSIFHELQDYENKMI